MGVVSSVALHKMIHSQEAYTHPGNIYGCSCSAYIIPYYTCVNFSTSIYVKCTNAQHAVLHPTCVYEMQMLFISTYCRQAMSAACWTLTILVGWLTVACGQSCLPEVNPHSYCGDSSCPPEDRIVGNPTDYCRTFFQFQPAHIFPDEWELLFDSDDYRQNNVLGSVFLEREFDSDASTLREVSLTMLEDMQRKFEFLVYCT